MSVGDVMNALADQLRTTLASEVPGIQVEARMNISPSPDPIALDVYPGDPFQTRVGYGLANNEIALVVRARVNTPDSEGAQDVLLSLMDQASPSSVALAVEADRTLGGAVEDVVVAEGPSNFGIFPDASGQGAFLGCTWELTATPHPSGYTPPVPSPPGFGEGGYGG